MGGATSLQQKWLDELLKNVVWRNDFVNLHVY